MAVLAQVARRGLRRQGLRRLAAAAQAGATACWSCGAALTGEGVEVYFCTGVACGKIQPVRAELASDAFATLGVVRCFDVEVSALEVAFKALQRRLHPDLFATATPEEKEHSASAAALVNRSYRTLRSPLARAKHLLELGGAPLGEDDSSAAPLELLQEMMELREELDDAGSDANLMAELDSRSAAELADAEASVAKAFAAGDLAAARAAVVRLVYITRWAEEVRERL